MTPAVTTPSGRCGHYTIAKEAFLSLNYELKLDLEEICNPQLRGNHVNITIVSIGADVMVKTNQ